MDDDEIAKIVKRKSPHPIDFACILVCICAFDGMGAFVSCLCLIERFHVFCVLCVCFGHVINRGMGLWVGFDV